MSQDHKPIPTGAPAESPNDLQIFQKRLVLHVLVMDNYTLVNRRSSRLEFQSALTAANIETIITAIRDELNEHFLKSKIECGPEFPGFFTSTKY